MKFTLEPALSDSPPHVGPGAMTTSRGPRGSKPAAGTYGGCQAGIAWCGPPSGASNPAWRNGCPPGVPVSSGKEAAGHHALIDVGVSLLPTAADTPHEYRATAA